MCECAGSNLVGSEGVLSGIEKSIKCIGRMPKLD